jgi:hypothetical protein
MSETPIYFFLAQLNLLLTANLRMGFVFLALSVCSGLWFRRQPVDQRLSTYWLGWSSASVMLALGSAWALQTLLDRPNILLQEATYSGMGLAAAVVSSWAAQFFVRKGYHSTARIVYLISVLIGCYCIYAYSFSRSDKDLLSLGLTLPIAVALSYFPLCFLNRPPARGFHLLFLASLFPLGLIYYGWMYPLVKHIPQVGEFYPFINLYDWILPVFVILYLGNIYIDFWLNKRKNTLALVWNYPMVVTAILCQWLSTNILDTLAL